MTTYREHGEALLAEAPLPIALSLEPEVEALPYRLARSVGAGNLLHFLQKIARQADLQCCVVISRELRHNQLI